MPKKLFQRNFCAIPWTGFELEPNGRVKNCIISKDILGDTNQNTLEEILNSDTAKNIKREMLSGGYPSNCQGCYYQEENRKTNFDNISSRTYYTKELGPHIQPGLLDSEDNFDLKHVDLRWSNLCNQACVYCGPGYSSQWSKELGKPILHSNRKNENLRSFVYKNIANLQNIYLAGGEPLLMKENLDLLTRLYDHNRNCTIRVNTNLSKTDTGVFDLLCRFDNVHWTVSVESIEERYEYIRHGGNWKDFLNNLETIRTIPDHKISFNMLYFVLNYKNVFDCISLLQNLGFHNNSFVLGPLYLPTELNIHNLPKTVIEEIQEKFKEKIDRKPGYLLQNSLENVLKYLNEPFDKNPKATYNMLKQMDQRRNLDSETVFPEVYEALVI